MPAAAAKPQLKEITVEEYAKLRSLIDRIGEEQAMRKREDDTSIKDVVAHRAHWIELFLGWYRDGQTGQKVEIPAKGYKWSELKTFNADLRARQADLSWLDARASLEGSHRRLLDFIDRHDDDDLYAGPMKGGNSPWTTGRWAEAAGRSHYRSAAKWIRACLRSDLSGN
ncbi:ClbS/DfsB family four-helix bundle protein [Neorhizobium sp. S3-V5DH]|uniref:ClbS/DfsB family four-helix bundle protein n=1 Tax=Neorhizobium sp. S3-V5DH TaxID=2485166 RepID=UPI000DDBFCE9|nr:ClbS/DfsB family four-helix bundle protein [Neorhizobium sp. S3-V5DH]TCV75742.1 hypothetical protein EDE09_10121 [Neorhizobium sp. S3-V5DH]